MCIWTLVCTLRCHKLLHLVWHFVTSIDNPSLNLLLCWRRVRVSHTLAVWGIPTVKSPLESGQVNVEAALVNHHTQLFVLRTPPPGTALHWLHPVREAVLRLKVNLLSFSSSFWRHNFLNREQTNSHLKRSPLSIHHNVSFRTKLMMLYNYVIHFVSAARDVFEIRTLTPPFFTSGTVNGLIQ